MLCPVGRIGDKPDNVVKGRSKVMDNFAREDAEPKRDFPLSVVLRCLQHKLIVGINENRVFALKEGVDFGLEINDVLVGPF